MRVGLSEIVCILDRSGSMGSIVNDAIGGFNTFLTEQKAVDGEANITIVLFNDRMELLYDNVDIKTIPDMRYESYRPNGGTALYDAIGYTMVSVGDRLAKTAEADRPEKVIVVILTDGEENSSKTYAQLRIKQMIQHQEQVYNWAFVYLAANVDAITTGSAFGMTQNNTLSFSSTSTGTRQAFENMNVYSKSIRCMSKSATMDSIYASAKLESVEL